MGLDNAIILKVNTLNKNIKVPEDNIFGNFF